MNRALTLTIGLLLITSPVCAEQVRVDVSKTDCLRLLTDSAEYVPGVSVTGQAVTPADLDDNISLPDLNNMAFPVYLNLERDFPFWNSEMNMGFLPLAQVEIRNGQVFVNGRVLSETGKTSLKTECAAYLKK